ncbi:hypothetical protein A3Q56_03093 [Intoshia linei]|uniref:Retrotransposon gag domain-containing protein n=1 Tax=Intoshia linei TaxID=1819745 RepID=A0A177B4V8_9BILA|nr:hypothetical protein A3Q56_03093 [Intoshia linei]
MGPTARSKIKSRCKDIQSVTQIKLELNRWKETNLIHEKLRFQEMKQDMGETVDEFVYKLESIANICKFDNQKERVLIQLIAGINSSFLQRELLS